MFCVALQNDRSQTDLITKLSNVSMHNPDVLQQMYGLYDGTQASLENTPDIRMFTNQLPGEKCGAGISARIFFDVQVAPVSVSCR